MNIKKTTAALLASIMPLSGLDAFTARAAAQAVAANSAAASSLSGSAGAALPAPVVPGILPGLALPAGLSLDLAPVGAPLLAAPAATPEGQTPPEGVAEVRGTAERLAQDPSVSIVLREGPEGDLAKLAGAVGHLADGSGLHGAAPVVPVETEPAPEASRWYDRLFTTKRRTAEAYGAVSAFWSGLAAGRLSPQDTRLALRRLAADEFPAAVRSPGASPMLLSMSNILYDGGLDLDRTAGLIRAASGMKEVASSRVDVNEEHHFDMDYAPGGGFRGSKSYNTGGRTFVYSVEISQAPGATEDSPALVRLKFFYPAFIHMGGSEILDGTSLKGLSSSEGLYLVKSLSSLGEAGRLSGRSDKALGGAEVGTGLAALVKALDASKSPSFRNYTSGYGRVGTSHYYRVSDAASGAETGDDELGSRYDADADRAASQAGRQAALLGTYVVERFLGVPRGAVPAPKIVDAAEGTVLAGNAASLLVSVLVTGTVVLLGTIAYSLFGASAQGVTAAAVVEASSDLPSFVTGATKVAAGIGAFLGFLLGSVPRGEDGGWGWDMPGAVVGALIGALLFGGGQVLLAGSVLYGASALGFGGLLALVRYLNTRGPATPRGGIPLQEGLNTFEGTDAKAKLRAARKAYQNASFSHEGRYASRGRENWYGDGGPGPQDIAVLREGLMSPSYDLFDTLVLLLREAPGKPGEPAVVVVRGAANLRRVVAAHEGLNVPGIAETIPYGSLLASVGYAWR